MEGFKDEKSGKKGEGRWLRDKPMAQVYYEESLKKVQNPDTGQFYNKRDNDGNVIKGTDNPKHIIKQIVRVRRKDGSEFLYSNGYVLGYNAFGEPVRECVQIP